MPRNKVTVTAAISFIAADYANTVTALVKAGSAIDKAEGNALATVTQWAISTAVGIKANVLTMDNVKSQLVAATPIALRKANVAASTDKAIAVDALEACGARLKSWYYTMNRIAKAGDASLDRIINGEAFNSVARGTAAVQKQDKGKRASTAKETPATETETADSVTTPTSAPRPMAALATELSAMRKSLSVPTLAKNDQAALATIIADATAMMRAVEAHIAGKVEKAKAAKAKVAIAA